MPTILNISFTAKIQPFPNVPGLTDRPVVPSLESLMFEAGYYKSNYRALRLRELIRWHGRYRGCWSWLKSRIMPNSLAGSGWMPGLWVENECKRDDLSQYFWDLTRRHRANFEQLGYVPCRLSKIMKSLDPENIDSGSIFYLDPKRCYLGQLIYSQRYLRGKHKVINHIVLAFTAVFELGSFSCTNNKLSFDSASGGEVIRMNSTDVIQIHDRFREELLRRPNMPRPFADFESLRQWFDARQITNFEDRVRRGLFVLMTESEISAAQAEMERFRKSLSVFRPRSSLRLKFWPTTVLIISLVLFILRRYSHSKGNWVGDNTIHYQGQEFKMSQPYDSYEDYKDDPNNLDTNELGRIEQTMESVKVPTSFNDRNKFTHFMFFYLEFPGYGLGFLGGSARKDDGSSIEIASVEIPQRDKERVITVRSEPDGSLKLLDDFIYNNDATNSIERALLERGQLQYFDEKGRMVRKKFLEK